MRTAPPRLPASRRLCALFRTTEPRVALASGAQVYVNFLSLTRRSGWLQGHISKQADVDEAKAATAREALRIASRRYLGFCELRKDVADAVPTRDISVVWSADLLRPHLGERPLMGDGSRCWYHHQQHRLLQSGNLFEKATGRRWSITSALQRAAGFGLLAAVSGGPVGAAVGAAFGAATSYSHETGALSTAAIRRFDADDSGIVSPDERTAALDEWQAAYDKTDILWRRRFGGGTYFVPPGHMPAAANDATIGRVGTASPSSPPSGTTRTSTAPPTTPPPPTPDEMVDQLADAVASQASFVGRILALGPKVVDDAWINRAITRYSQFLALCEAHPGDVHVPTLDVDLIWHAHMLSPLDYREDCHDLVGRLLPHDDQMDDAALAAAFEATKERWHAAHGAPYVATRGRGGGTAGTHYAGCGSCGWGHNEFHAALPHAAEESFQVIDAYGGGSGGGGGDVAAGGAGAGAGREPGETLGGADNEGVSVLAEPAAESWAQPWASDDRFQDTGVNPDEVLVDPWAAPVSEAGSDDSSWGWGGDGGDAGGDAGDCGGCGG